MKDNPNLPETKIYLHKIQILHRITGIRHFRKCLDITKNASSVCNFLGLYFICNLLVNQFLAIFSICNSTFKLCLLQAAVLSFYWLLNLPVNGKKNGKNKYLSNSLIIILLFSSFIILLLDMRVHFLI